MVMDGMRELIVICFLILALMAIGIFMGIPMGMNAIRSEAFERGHMTECPGKTGYFWECD